METKAPIIEGAFGISWLSFNLSNVLMLALTTIILIVVITLATRSLQMKPTGAQNFMEWLVEFVKNLVTNAMDWKTGKLFLPLGLTLISFILVGNVIGMVTAITIGDTAWWGSPTADAGVTLTLAAMVVVLTHYYGVKLQGFKAYGKGYFSPSPIMFPFKLIEEFTNTLTLGLRLFGNMFAGGVLTALILGLATKGVGGFLGALLPMIAWQGFSLFVAGIQAFIFTLLTMIYISHKVNDVEATN